MTQLPTFPPKGPTPMFPPSPEASKPCATLRPPSRKQGPSSGPTRGNGTGNFNDASQFPPQPNLLASFFRVRDQAPSDFRPRQSGSFFRGLRSESAQVTRR
jgi:hypothetical protein